MIKPRGYKDLADAIVLRAVEDWRLAQYLTEIDGEPAEKVMGEVESFLKSDWFTLLCDIDPVIILEQLEKERRK